MVAHVGIVSTGNFGLTVLILCVFGVVASGANAVGASMYTEMFPTKVRYTGVAIGTQLGFLVAGFAPAIEARPSGPRNGWLAAGGNLRFCLHADRRSGRLERTGNQEHGPAYD